MEGREEHLLLSGDRPQADGHLHHDPEEPLGAREQGKQIEPRRIERRPPEGEQFPFHGNDGHGEEVVNGEAILQAVDAPGVLRDVPADGAGDLGGGIRGVEQAIGRGGLGNREVAHAGLEPGRLPGGIDLEDLAELREHEEHPGFVGQRAPGEPGPGAPGHHGDPLAVAIAQHALHLIHRRREHGNEGQLAQGRKAIALKGAQGFRRGDNLQARHGAGQGLCQGGAIHRRSLAIQGSLSLGFWAPGQGQGHLQRLDTIICKLALTLVFAYILRTRAGIGLNVSRPPLRSMRPQA